MSRSCYVERTDQGHMLIDYRTGETLRAATDEEVAASSAAAEGDDGRGIIEAEVSS